MSEAQRWQLESLDLDAVERLAQAMLRRLPAATVIGLVGTLGAGKTTLVQAIARAAGIDSADVTSPTFTLMQSYQGSVTVHHLDAYRIADEDEFLELGVEELFDTADAWTLIEWADRVAGVMPANTLWVEIRGQDSGPTRAVTFQTAEQSYADAIDHIIEDVTQS